MLERYNSGTKSFRFMFAEGLRSSYKLSEGGPEIEERSLQIVPVMLVCSEKESAICFLDTAGKADYSGFFSAEEP